MIDAAQFSHNISAYFLLFADEMLWVDRNKTLMFKNLNVQLLSKETKD